MFQLFQRASASAPCNARDLVTRGARLIDVRTHHEYAAGHLPNSVNIPVLELEERMDEVGRGADPVVVYCRSGARSATAANMLRRAGYRSVCDLGAMSRF